MRAISIRSRSSPRFPRPAWGRCSPFWSFARSFSVIAVIGIILLIGIVKKNGIMMVDFALEAERKEGKSPVDAIYQACLLRFRPIMMTTMAALLGALPLALGSGVGSELRRPLGIAIVGGLIYQPDAHPLHDAGHLSCLRPAGAAHTGPSFRKLRTATGAPASSS